MSMRSKESRRLVAFSVAMAACAGVIMLEQDSRSSTCDMSAPPAPPPPPPRVFTPPPAQQNVPSIPNAVDVTDMPQMHENLTEHELGQGAMGGLQHLPDEAYPNLSTANQNGEGIVEKHTAETQLQKTSPCSVDFGSGEMILAVNSPSKLATAKISFGEVCIDAPGAVMVKGDKDVLRVFNLDAKGTNVKVKLDQGPFAGPADPVYSVAAGHEMVVGKDKLKRSQVRPADGISRRRISVTEGGRVAVAEYSLESVLNTSALIAVMAQSSDGREKRVLHDLSKMAAVLNYVNGTQGFSSQPAQAAQMSVSGEVRDGVGAAKSAESDIKVQKRSASTTRSAESDKAPEKQSDGE